MTAHQGDREISVTDEFGVWADQFHDIPLNKPAPATLPDGQGQITNVGVNTNVSGSNITQLSQTFVSAGVGGGDSGSPVFSLAGSNATLRGILWGGLSNGRSFVFSPLGNIEGVLGNIITSSP